jgi:putative ABC transport system permease protein
MVRSAVSAADADLAVSDMATMERIRNETMTQERVAAQTVSLFAILGLALAAIGTYGVVAYATARRAREFAIRVALGAPPRNLARLVMSQGILMAGGGVLAGVVAAIALHRVAASQLSQLARSDPRIYAGVALVLLVIAAIAIWIPARRALRVDPALALRAE